MVSTCAFGEKREKLFLGIEMANFDVDIVQSLFQGQSNAPNYTIHFLSFIITWALIFTTGSKMCSKITAYCMRSTFEGLTTQEGGDLKKK